MKRDLDEEAAEKITATLPLGIFTGPVDVVGVCGLAWVPGVCAKVIPVAANKTAAIAVTK